jgi:hypothetical protein
MTTTTTTGAVGSVERMRLMALGQLSKQDCGCGATPEVDAGLCPLPQICFPRFFPGQLVQPDDLQGIEQLFFTHAQLRARYLIGWGIACGFRVGIDAATPTPTGAVPVKGASVRVECGYGIDHYGRDVRMVSNVVLSLEQLLAERAARIQQAMGDPWCTIPGCQPQPVTHYCLAVRYKECLDKPVPSYTKQCGPPKTVCDYSRVCESVEIRLFGEGELPPDTPPAVTPTQAWCGVQPPAAGAPVASAASLSMVGARAQAALAISGLAGAMNAPPAAPAAARAARAAAAAPAAAIVDGPNCVSSFNSAAIPCQPCVDNPWLTLACFDIEQGYVLNLDCSVRRTIWSMAEMQDLLAVLLCYFYRLIGK